MNEISNRYILLTQSILLHKMSTTPNSTVSFFFRPIDIHVTNCAFSLPSVVSVATQLEVHKCFKQANIFSESYMF